MSSGKKKRKITVDVSKVNKILDAAVERPMSQAESTKLKKIFNAMADHLSADEKSDERTRKLFGLGRETKAASEDTPTEGAEQGIEGNQRASDGESKGPRPGHGRNGAEAFTGAQTIESKLTNYEAGCACPDCLKGRLYPQKDKVLVRIVGQAPLHGNVHKLQSVRCHLCGQSFSAEPPEGVGDEKYDASAVAMVAVLKYGSGMPFNRIESMQQSLGVPLPASTQWDLMEDAAEELKPLFHQLVHDAAQGEVLHHDDTGMKVMEIPRLESDTRSGIFTTGLISDAPARQIAMFFTGSQHAGENLRDVVALRNKEIQAPVVMCDALSRNVSKLDEGAYTLAHCLAHGRRNFAEVADAFPAECLHVLEEIGKVYGFDRQAREMGLDPKARLRFHQTHSEPVMKALHKWLTAQMPTKRVEDNSRLGKAIKYLLRHWKPLTLFLRQAGAPLDNNICERALKTVVLHRKNALYYRTLNGAQVGDLFMSLIQTCVLNDVNPFDYLKAVLANAEDVQVARTDWMPWTFKETLARKAAS